MKPLLLVVLGIGFFWGTFTGMVATALLVVISVLTIALLAGLLKEGTVDRTFLSLSIILSLAFLGVFCAPFWFDEHRASTSQDHFELANKLSVREPIFKDVEKEFRHYLISAQGGNAEAQQRVAEALLYGQRGQTVSSEAGLTWLKKSAAQGNKSAEQMLGSQLNVGN